MLRVRSPHQLTLSLHCKLVSSLHRRQSETGGWWPVQPRQSGDRTLVTTLDNYFVTSVTPPPHQLHCTLGAKTAQQCGLWRCCTPAHCAALTGSMLGEASAETAAETAAGTHWAGIYVSTYLQYLDTVCLHLTLPRPIYKHGGATRSSLRFPPASHNI